MNILSKSEGRGSGLVVMSLLVAGALSAIGCGSKDEGSGDSETISSASFVSKLVSCGLATEGRSQVLPNEDYWTCQLDCFAQMEGCEFARGYACGDYYIEDSNTYYVQSNEFDRCVSNCYSFQCGDGTGVPERYLCDGENDCKNGADEAQCDGSQFFDCLDGEERVLAVDVCDGYADCDDSSDEAGCTKKTTFSCDNGEEIPVRDRCDGYLDCESAHRREIGEGFDDYSSPPSDVSDEMGCPEATLFHCSDGFYIDIYEECDGAPDCPDGSDEGPDCMKLTCGQ